MAKIALQGDQNRKIWVGWARASIISGRALQGRPGSRKPSFDRGQFGIIRDLLAQDASPTAIAEAAGVLRQMVYRVQDDPAKAEAMLADWGM